MSKEPNKKGQKSDRQTGSKPRSERKKHTETSGKGTTKAKGSPTKPVPQLPDGYIAVQMLATTKITPNDYNPNELTEEEFKEYRAEAKRLGRLPKPLFVKPNGVIMDGEHGWKVAQELGWAEVPCEVEDLEDFEAMRRTYKRNRHGSFNQVLLGRMFETMMEMRGLSGRDLANEIGVSEGTVRNALLYAEAAKVRNRYAPGEGDAQIARLSVKKVRAYMKKPEDQRDAWLDAVLKAGKPARQRRKPSVKKPADEAPPLSTDTEAGETATTAAAQVEAPQANDDVINAVGQNSACPESPAQGAPTTQSGGEASECTDAVASESPTGKVGQMLADWKGLIRSERHDFAGKQPWAP
jgi:ParB-like chromosome segregation protein Spo0J